MHYRDSPASGAVGARFIHLDREGEMTHADAKYYLPLVQAMAEGKTIQVLGADNWHDCAAPTFCEPAAHYRIKPEPRRWWLQYSCLGLTIHTGPSTCDPTREIIEVQEVLK